VLIKWCPLSESYLIPYTKIGIIDDDDADDDDDDDGDDNDDDNDSDDDGRVKMTGTLKKQRH
jgi:hypothetical protein